MHKWVMLLGLAACGDDGGSAIDAAPIVGEPANLTGITAAHNQVRAMVQTGTPLPALTWSSDLAATAAAWVAQCKDTEAPTGLVDHNAGRSTGHPYYVGENIFASSGAATGQQAVTSWAAEGTDYTYATNACAGGKTCGHYTQVVWRETHEIGCALGDCPSLQFKSTIVCDYGPGGNSGGKPY
jgi:pathogenesis-related protein 1